MKSIKSFQSHKEGIFETKDNLHLFEQSWEPVNELRNVLIFVHGLAEHSSRYTHFAEYLSGYNTAVETFDLRGHGRSQGKRNYIDSFSDYLDDFRIFYERVFRKYPKMPIFLCGQSMGGTISSLFVLEHRNNIRGLVLSAPVLKVSKDISPFLQKISSFIGTLFPKLPTIKLDCRGISRDKSVVADYDCDPLVYRKGIIAKTGAELIRAAKEIQGRLEEMSLPILILHGASDPMSDINGSRKLYSEAKSNDKTLKEYENLFHCILHEPEKDLVMEDIRLWLSEHSR
jgi:alpha-beta hydrolase superfamily lysophospholipase